MPNLINQTFFVGDLIIPNLNSVNSPADLERLNIFINKYEPECLLRIMGYPLYKAFGSESSQRMTDLLEGAEYTDGEGNLRKWKGLIHDTNLSLIAGYIYFFYQQALAAQTSGAGTVVQKPEAGVAYSPADKMSKAWNYFSVETFDMTHFLWLKKDGSGVRVYPEFSYHQFCETRRISRKIDSIFQL